MGPPDAAGQASSHILESYLGRLCSPVSKLVRSWLLGSGLSAGIKHKTTMMSEIHTQLRSQCCRRFHPCTSDLILTSVPNRADTKEGSYPPPTTRASIAGWGLSQAFLITPPLWSPAAALHIVGLGKCSARLCWQALLKCIKFSWISPRAHLMHGRQAGVCLS